MHLLVVGGGGPVGIALLHLIGVRGWTASVVDPREPTHPHTARDWEAREYTLGDLEGRLRRDRADVVVDLAPTLDKPSSVLLCDGRGVPLVNASMVPRKTETHTAASSFLDHRPPVSRCAHIVSAGMNPGAVNAMAEEIVGRYGQPHAISIWEHDETLPEDGVLSGPATTWCADECREELAEDWAFEALGGRRLAIHETALSRSPVRYEDCGAPVHELSLAPDAEAVLVGHEECVYLGRRHDTAARFVYGFHPENMRLLLGAGGSWEPELLIQTPNRRLLGRDIVGVACSYEETRMWRGQYCLLENAPATPNGTNATCLLVAAGLVASVELLVSTNVPVGVHLTHELPGWLPAFRSLVDTHEYELPMTRASHRAGTIAGSTVGAVAVHEMDESGVVRAR